MLVLDPSRRFTIEQIKHHRWMLIEGASSVGLNCDIGSKSTQEPNEQILRLMVSLGIDAQKTRESLRVSGVFIIHYFNMRNENRLIFVLLPFSSTIHTIIMPLFIYYYWNDYAHVPHHKTIILVYA